jgi:ABC-2 type transport system ATP-binding protein
MDSIGEAVSPRLRAVGLHKRFGDRQALAGLSFELRPGEVLGLLGPNGAGKSTFVRLLLGLEVADAGRFEVDAAAPRRGWLRRVGVAPQELALYEELTGRENLEFLGRLQGLTGDDLRSSAAATLEVVGLSDRGDSRVSGWSEGMKRRLNLAAALIHGPDLIVLDEPTTGVDAASRAAILDEVRRRADAGAAVLLATHHLDEAARVCDRALILDGGRVVAEGSIPDLVARHGQGVADGLGLERAVLRLTSRGGAA